MPLTVLLALLFAPKPLQPTPITPTPAEKSAIRAAVLHSTGTWPCEDDPEGHWRDNLQFESLPLAPNQRILMVHADIGCTAAGLGVNNALWIFRMDTPIPTPLATPKDGLNGYLSSIDPTLHHGLHDLTIAWNASPTEDGLTYLHFDGTRYKVIGAATLYSGDAEHGSKLVPQPPRPRP
jgi:hypothetical protein